MASKLPYLFVCVVWDICGLCGLSIVNRKLSCPFLNWSLNPGEGSQSTHNFLGIELVMS